MSGVEVAGIVLAVLPLIISALEDYNENLDPVKSFMRWERALPQYIRKLRNQHVHYEQTLRLLLAPITNECELAEMIAEPNGTLWKEPDMEAKLEHKLGVSYKAYQQTITDIEDIMKKIASKLGLEEVENVSRNYLETILVVNGKQKAQTFEFKKRAKFSLSKKRIKYLLEQLDDCNKELERFTEKSEKLEPYRKSSKPLFAQKLQKIQLYASMLHQTLVEAFSCSCRGSHCTNLRLEQREFCSKSYMRRSTSPSGPVFTISFTDKSSTRVKEAQISFSEEDRDLDASMSDLHLSTPMTRSVSFLLQTPPPSPRPSEQTMRSKSDSSPQQEEIRDLCSIVRSFNEEEHRMGLSLNNGKLCGVHAIPVPGLRPSRYAETVTLEDILNGIGQVRLSKKERYTLAVTVASSILQLHASPWISDQWSKRDIVFYRMETQTHSIDTEHPHVAQKPMPGPRNSNRTAFVSKNATLLTLGMVLLELYFGRPYEQHMPANIYIGNDNSLAMLCTANEWFTSEQEDLSAAFQSAIAHCLRCYADPLGSLQESSFLQAAVEHIVQPLQKELYQFLGKSAV